MKKIINGKMYDTDTAKVLGTWSSPHSVTDFAYYTETLHQKRTGEFFLFGDGGPASRYAAQVERSRWSSGSKIIPLTWEDAQKWAEEHLDAKDYEAIFGEVSEDDSRVTISLSLPASTLELAKRAAAQAGTSLSAYIDHLITG